MRFSSRKLVRREPRSRAPTSCTSSIGDGVRDFLASRGIELPEGEQRDSASAETIWGPGNRKNQLSNKAIEGGRVQAFEGSVRLIRHLRGFGFKTAVVTSSENCHKILRFAGLTAMFDEAVDGQLMRAHNLAGKPAPDSFLAAVALLRVNPIRAVVIEDAIAGVRAAHQGHFGLVIGVAHSRNAEALRLNGADRVVNDLTELID